MFFLFNCFNDTELIFILLKIKKANGIPIALLLQRASAWFHTTNVNNNKFETIYIDFIRIRSSLCVVYLILLGNGSR